MESLEANLSQETRPEGVVVVKLVGALDIQGADAVDLELSRLAGCEDRLLLDLSGVDFLASIGIRSLVVAGKTIARRGGRMAICAAQPNVAAVLESAGVGEFLSICAGGAEGLSTLHA